MHPIPSVFSKDSFVKKSFLFVVLFYFSALTATAQTSILATDTFTGMNGTLLQNHTSDSGYMWVRHPLSSGNAEIQSGSVKDQYGNAPLYYLDISPITAEYDVTLNVTGSTYVGGPAGRIDTISNTGYYIYWVGTTNEWRFYRRVNGTSIVIGSYTGDAPSLTVPRTLKLEIRDATKKLFINGIERIVSTDNTITGAGRPGIFFSGTTSDRGDNFSVVSAGGTTPTTTPDTTTPSIPTGLSATAISTSQINLSWTASTDNVGVTGYNIYRNGTQIATIANTSYNDTGLTVSTAYSYTVQAYDAAGNLSARSAGVSATTQSVVVVDTTPPTVSLSSPIAGATVSGTVTITATASDNMGVAGVQFKLDGVNLQAEDTTSPYSVSWNTTGSTNGTHTLTATARDAAGNITTSISVSVTVSNATPDTTAPTIPTGLSATTVSTSQINLSWTASTDNVGVTGYRIYRNGTQLITTSTTSYNNTGLTASTLYAYTVQAYDAAGNTSVQSVSTSTTTQGITTTSGAIYVSLSGSDTSGDGSLGNPYASISKALTVLTSGGTIIVRNGTYTDRPGMLVNDYYSATIPSGSASAFTTIKAETPYGVRLKWTGGLNYWDAPVLIAKARYVHVDGFIYEMLNLDNPSFVVWIYSSKIKITRTIVKRSRVDAWGGWYSVNGSDNLIEDAAGVGAVRYGFATGGPTSSDQRNIFRRVVGRMDYANTNQPKATFAVYGNDATTDVRDHLLQNTIAIDGQRPSANGVEEKYGGYYNPKTASYIRYQGAITLNEAVGHAGMFAQEWGVGIDIKNSLVWDLPNSMSYTVGIRANTASSIAVDSVTVGGNISGGPLWSSSSGGAVSATNSALGGTHANLLNNTPGAVIMKRYGVSGTFWGEPGYDQLTNEDLWPWPYEDKIKAVFAEVNDPPSGNTPTTNNTKRGFVADGNGLYGGPITLTSYIWEYLGTPCPGTICTGTGGTTTPPPAPTPDTTAPSIPTNLTAGAISTSQISLSWTASTDNVGVAGYRIYRNGTQLITTSTTSYSDTGLTASTAYSYTVQAYDAAGNASAQSTSVSATTQTATTTPPPSTKFTLNDRVQVSSGPLNVRATASATGTLLGTQATNALGTVIGGPIASGGFNWWNINYDTGVDGWSAEDFLVKYVVTTTPPVTTCGGTVLCVGTGQPYTTIQAAVNAASAGYTVLVFDGNYAGFLVNKSGTVGNPIIIKANGSNAVINADGPTGDGIRFENVNYITLDGFKIQNTSQRCVAARGATPTAPMTGLIVRNNTCTNPGVEGFYLSEVSNSLVENNIISGPGAIAASLNHGIYLANAGSKNTTIRGNIISGARGSGSEGIHINGDVSIGGDGIISGLLIEKNTIFNNANNGINMDGLQDSVIQNNVIYGNAKNGFRDYQIDAAAGPKNLKIINNVIIVPSGGGVPIKLTEDLGSHTIFNNILLTSASNGSLVTSNTNFKSNNNIVNSTFSSDGGTTLLSLASWQGSGFDINSLTSTAASLFTDSITNNYTLKSGSPAIDKGAALFNTVSAPTIDLTGASRPQGVAYDIGAYEYAIGTTTPPPTPTPDTTVPSTPTNLFATPISSSQINLSWTASTDNVGVTGYDIYRDGALLATVTTTSYSNTSLSASTAYTYYVRAKDAAGNFAQSASVSATTQAATTTPPPSTKFTLNDRVQVSSGPLNVRATASATGTLLGSQATNALGTIVGGPTAAGGFNWWNINYDTGVDGWSAEDFLVKYVVTTTPPVATGTYYISPSGSDTNSGTTSGSPWKTFAKAFGTMKGGDELILINGIYGETQGTGYISYLGVNSAQPPSGISFSNQTYVHAQNSGNVTVNGGLFIGRSTRKDSYIKIQGITFEGGGQLYNTSFDTVKDSGFHGGFGIGTNDHSNGNTDNLVEDVWVWASGSRIIANNYRADRNVWRRVIIRGDGCGTTACSGSGNPNVGVTVYNSRDVSFQNVMVVDRILSAGDSPYANFATAQHDPGGGLPTAPDYEGRNEWLGTMSINPPDSGYYFEADNVITGYPTWTMKNVLTIGAQGEGINIGLPYNGATLNVIENATVISGIGSGYRLAPGQNVSTVRNIIASKLSNFGVNSASTPSYVDVYSATGGNYNQTICSVGCRTTNPQADGTTPSLLYPIRIEQSSTLKGAGFGGVDIGANIVYRYGTDSTRFSDVGYNTLSATQLWPWPNEARIKAEMCANTTRGFCATGNQLNGVNPVTLTSYIWEALGNPMPTSLYSTTTPPPTPTPDTTVPSTPTNLFATPISSSQINLSWTASTDNVGVAGYRIYRNGTQLITTGTTSYSDTGLTASTAYSYTISAYDAAGNSGAQSMGVSATTQAVTPTPTVTISASPAGVTTGGLTTITWSSINATSCTASGGWTGTKATSGTQSITNLTVNTAFTLACTGTGGTTTQTVTVTVTPPPTCTIFTYSTWGTCQSNNTQSRTTTASSPQGCTGGTPVLTQSCVYTPPSPPTQTTCTIFTYSVWGTCQSDSTQSRTTTSTSPQGCTGGTPTLSQVCTYTPPVTPPPATSGGGSSGGGSVTTSSGGGATSSSGGGTTSSSSGGGVVIPPITGGSNTSGTTATTPSTSGGQATVSLPPLTGPFSIGMNNNQVKLLQQMLIKDGSLSGEATGYYGALTQKAVEVFQTKYNLITSGTPSTTGFGLAGPSTRAKLNALYAGTGGSSTDRETLLASLRKQVAELTAILQTLIAKLAALRAAKGM